MGLYDTLRRIGGQIHSQREYMINETKTVIASIQPFIRALGYETSNLFEVKTEVIADAKPTGGERVDYVILRDGRPVIFIEAKSAKLSLSEKFWKQLYEYYNATDVRFGVLTNGLEYRFYTDLVKRNIMDNQPFLRIDMLNLEEGLVKELELFTRGGFDEEGIIFNAQKRRIAELIRREMESPSAALVNHFAGQVNSGSRLFDRDMARYGELVKGAWGEVVEGEVAEYLKRGGESKDVELPRLPDIFMGEDSVVIPIFADYYEQRFDAKMPVKEELSRNRGEVYVCFEGGEWIRHVEAALIVKRSVNPDIQADSANAANFWRFTHPETGEATPIAQLFNNPSLCRQLLAQRQPVPPSPIAGGEIPIFAEYSGHRIEAMLPRKYIEGGKTFSGKSKCIMFGGEQMWPMGAMRKAKRSVDRSYDAARDKQMGMQFWHVEDPADGKAHPISDIGGFHKDADHGLRRRLMGQ